MVAPKISSYNFAPPLSPVRKRRLLGFELNRPHQPPNSVFKCATFTLGVVEFDDQGRCHYRSQMLAIDSLLDDMKGQDPVILLFAHGWKHNAATDDSNLEEFCDLLNATARQMRDDGSDRPVIGIFLAWRGQSFYCGEYLSNVTFWDRKQAGLKVAMGAPRELLERLRQFWKSELRAKRNPVFVAIGHSFGGMIVYSALAQSLIGAAITSGHEVVPSFANLVLLVNPAFEAVRYLPIHDLLLERSQRKLGRSQSPIFVSVTAKNDDATGVAFPLGMQISQIEEVTRGWEERQTLCRTMGHVPFMRTHELDIDSNGDASLGRVQFDAANPYWVVSATKAVVDGHNGIWRPPFVAWVRKLVMQQVSKPQQPMLIPQVPRS